MKKYTHIMLAIDLDSHYFTMAQHAAQLADELCARLTLLHVIPISSDEVLKKDDASKRLALLGNKMAIPNIDQKIASGNIVNSIIDAAKSANVDLIIIGSKQSKTSQHKITDISQAILNDAHCDVITCRLTATSSITDSITPRITQ